MILSILLLNYLYLKVTVGFIGYLLFYLIVFLLLFVQIFFLWYSFIQARYTELLVKDVIQNAIFIPASRLVEMIIYVVLLVAIFMFLFEFIPGLLVFPGIGLGIKLTDWAFFHIMNGYGINKINILWERIH